MFRRLIAMVVCLSLPATAAAQNEKWTPQHVAKLRMVTEAVISPDGTQVAYVLAVPRDLSKEKDGGSWTELHVVDTKAGNATPFIAGPVNVSNIAWTTDGKQITLLAKRDKDATRCLYAIGTKGGEAHKIIDHATDIQGYSFSGDGKQVAFLATEPTPAAKKKQLDQGFNQEIYEEDQPFVRVWIADQSPERERGVGQPVANAPGSVRMLKLDGSASELHWNPKEDKLAVALAPSPGIDDHIMFRKVHIVEFQSPERERPVVVKATNLNNPGKLGQLAWSPDGKRLAMITGADKHDPKEGRLWIYYAHKNAWAKPDFNFPFESIAWDPSNRLVALGSSGVHSRAAVLNDLEGELESTVTIWRPATIASNVSLSKNSASYIVHTPTHPPEVYLVGNKEERLTNSNSWLKDMAFAEQGVIKYTARDGLEIEGVIIYPLNGKPGERVPLVLNVHGGPEAHYSNGWITNYNALGQVAAAKGMAIFYPNYRGSTGYGVEFSMKGQKEAGGKEFDDLIDGVDHLVKLGRVDEKKVGITGGSYGGYATAWGATYYSDRFAAGVMFVGISDWISCSGTTDIAQEMFLVHHRKWLWDDWDYFAKASPLKYLDKAKTPLLIMHGKNDPRVNPGQSLELYRHLKVRGKAPVRLVLYPGEGHGNRRAASRLDYNIRLLQWMEHYLKGPGGAMPPMEIDYGLEAPAKKTTDSTGGRPPRLPRLFEESFDTADHIFCGRRGCPCCIGP